MPPRIASPGTLNGSLIITAQAAFTAYMASGIAIVGVLWATSSGIKIGCRRAQHEAPTVSEHTGSTHNTEVHYLG